MADDLEAARRELDNEHAQFRKAMERVRKELEEVEKLGPEDDIYDRLGKLEDVVKEARTGGLVGGGAKGHRKALEQYRQLQKK